MSRFKTKVERDFKKTVSDLSDKRSQILDDFCTAYRVEKGILPSQVKLMERQEEGMVSWHFAMREPEVKGLKKVWFTIKFHMRTIKLRLKRNI